MPYTINGIGTWYYGKKNLHISQDTCEQCGAYADLSSYDTTKYFVFVYLPILPLGKVRVLNDCESCRRHSTMKLSDWNEARHDAVRGAVEEYERDRLNPDKAVAAVQACIAFQDEETFSGIGGRIEGAFADQASVLSLIGSAFEYFNRPREAERTYRSALNLAEDPAVREALGILLIKQGRAGEARSLLSHLIQDPEAVETSYFLVEGLQAEGLHDDAMQILGEIVRVSPELEEDKRFKRYYKTASKHAGTGKAVPAKKVKFRSPKAQRETDWSGRLAGLVFALILIVGIGAVGYVVYKKTQTIDVYLVSGLEQPYTVTLNGSSYLLSSTEPTKVNLPQRKELMVEASGIEPTPLEIEVPPWTALTSELTYVINPDQTAVLLWEQIEYSVTPVEKEFPYEIHLGKILHTFEGVDFVFKEFPDEIDLPTGKSRVNRERLSQIRDVEPTQAFMAAYEFVGMDVGLNYLRHVLNHSPEDLTTLRFVSNFMPQEEFAAMAEPQLQVRPVQMEWHRVYQTVMERQGKTPELLEEYGRLQNEEPDSSDLMYLYARILEDPVEAETWLEKAVAVDPPCPYAFNALGYQRLAEGRPQRALAHVKRAREMDPENDTFQMIETDTLLALGRYSELLSSHREWLQQDPLNSELVAEIVRLHVAAGEPERAWETATVHLEHLAQENDPSLLDPVQARHYLEAVYLLGRGDLKGFGQHMAQVEGARSVFQSKLALGDIDGAIEALEAEERNTAEDHLVAYLAFARSGNMERANEELQKAIRLMAEGTTGERVMSECLSGVRKPSYALGLAMDTESKGLALAVLAERHNDRRCRDLCRRLNYRLTFRRYYLSQWIS